MLRMSGCGPSLPAAFASPATGGSSAASTRRPPRFPALARAALACVLALAALATPALAQTTVPSGWSLTPDGLTAGAQFRLLFLSSTKRDGSVTTIATYNTFIQNLAAAGHTDIQAYSTGFRVVGCTAAVDARDNTSTTGTGVAIYWLDGNKVADTYADFYDGSWDDEANDTNESGTNGPDTSQEANYPITGCKHDGTEFVSSISSRSFALGSSQGPVIGRPNSSTTGHGPISTVSGNTFVGTGPTDTRPMYGLSAVFQVGADTTPPTPTYAETAAAGTQIALGFSEHVQQSNLPPASAITVTADGIAVTVTSVIASALNENLIAVSPLIRQGQAVVVTYTDPTTGDDANAFQDIAGNDAATFTTGMNRVPSVNNGSTVAATAPGAPTGLTATASGTTQIDLSWTAPADNGGRVITGYKIESSSDGGSNWSDLVANTSSTTTTYAHTGLAGATTRHYRVSAINTIGTGLPSNIDNATTTNNAPTVANAIPDQSAPVGTAFSYAFPANTFSDADSDALTYTATKADGTALPTWLSFTASTRAFSGTPQAADTGTVSVKVTASDGNGGSVSDEFDITVSAAADTTPPTLTRAVVPQNGLSMVLEFSENVDQSNRPPAAAVMVTADGSAVTVSGVFQQAALDAFRIVFSPTIRQGQAVVVTYADPTAGDDANAIQDIAGNDAATFTTGMNGVPAVTNGSTVAATAPGAPTGLSATASGSTQINLSWTAPADNGGRVITGYKIEVSSDNGSTWTDRVANTTTTTTTYAHTGLAASATRHYRVSAINTIGTGTASNIDNATTTAATNNPPTVANAIPDQSAPAGTAFSYAFPANTFSDADSDALTYTATKADGTALPSWLSFTGDTRTFAGTPAAGDVGTVTVKVTASDGNGGSVSDEFDILVSSAANNAATGAPTITGTAQVGQTLTAVTTAVMDADGLTTVSYTYHWIRVDGATETNINSLATASTYTLVAADQGKTIKVKVSFTDDASNPETRTSAATAAVTAAPVTDPDPEPEEVTVLAVDDAAETAEDTPVTIDVLANDSDPDGDTLTVVEVSAPTHGTAVVADTGAVVYTPEPDFHGTDRFTYVVGDGSGRTARAAVEVTVLPVNDPPLAGDDAAETAEDTSVTIAVLRNDSDPDGDALALVEASAPAHGSARLTDAGAVEYTPEPDFHGTDRFTYVVGDGSGLTAQAAVEVTVLPVNDPPQALGVIPDQTLDVGDGPAVLDLIPFFADRDGDALGYTAVVSDQAVAVRLTGATLTLTATRPGTATVTVTAQDSGGLTATQAFLVTTTDHPARGVVEDTLAALGRGHLASARATLGRRVETTGQEASRVTVAGLHVPLGTGAAAAGRAVAERWITGVAGGMPLQSGGRTGMDPAPGADAVGAPGALGAPAATPGMAGGAPYGAGASPTLSNVSPLSAGGQTDFLLALGSGQAGDGTARGQRWTVWGQSDQQAFGGERSPAARYDGHLQTAYVGVDARLSERWLAGVAVARSRGDGDWTFGSSTGRLTTSLTSVQPYLRWSDGGTTIWATAGGGTGSAEHERVRYGLQEESDLGLRLGLVEVRRRLATVGGVELQVRGDASWARLTTAAGHELIDALEVDVHQVRVGIDVSRRVRTAGGTLVEPFGEVHARHDGGSGQTGAGLEVAGGLRVARGMFRVEGMGRLLALHAADGYREHGGAVTLSVGDGARQPGLTLSLSPHWGARATASDALWQDHLFHQRAAGAAGAGRDDRALDARVDYGLQLPAGGLVTPFGIYGQSQYGRRLQVGLLLSRLGPLGLEVSGERSALRHPGRDDYRMRVLGRITFGGADNATASPDAVP